MSKHDRFRLEQFVLWGCGSWVLLWWYSELPYPWAEWVVVIGATWMLVVHLAVVVVGGYTEA